MDTSETDCKSHEELNEENKTIIKNKSKNTDQIKKKGLKVNPK
jgi:hypothetical protein